MSSPVPIAPPGSERERQVKAQERRERRSDALYFAGGAMLSAGLGMIRPAFGIMAGGFLLALPPLLELASWFIRGLRRGAREVRR